MKIWTFVLPFHLTYERHYCLSNLPVASCHMLELLCSFEKVRLFNEFASGQKSVHFERGMMKFCLKKQQQQKQMEKNQFHCAHTLRLVEFDCMRQ